MNVEVLSDTIPSQLSNVRGFVVDESSIYTLEGSDSWDSFRISAYNHRLKTTLSAVSTVHKCNNVKKVRIYRNDTLKLCIATENAMFIYKLNCGHLSHKLVFQQSFRNAYETPASNLIFQKLKDSFKLFDLRESRDYDCPSIPDRRIELFAYFQAEEHFVLIDDKCDNVYFCGLDRQSTARRNKITRAADLNIPTRGVKNSVSYVFGNIVIIACENRIFRFDSRINSFHEITKYLYPNLNNCSFKEENVSQDDEALYVHSNPRLYRIPIRGVDWSFLEVPRERPPPLACSKPTCPVCFEGYSNPKVLSKCGHTICDACEERITEDSALTCPICRAVTKLLNGERLPMNWTLKDLLENQGSGCKECGAKEELICGLCAGTHCASLLSKTH